MGLCTLLCSAKVGISITSSAWKRRYRSVTHTWVWNSFDRFAHLTGLLRSSGVTFCADSGRAHCVRRSVRCSRQPPDGWRCLCAPQVEDGKRAAETSSVILWRGQAGLSRMGRYCYRAVVDLALCRSVQPATLHVTVGPKYRVDDEIAVSRRL